VRYFCCLLSLKNSADKIRPLPSNGSVNIPAAINELLDTPFSMRFVSYERKVLPQNFLSVLSVFEKCL
jgi:hypothetical protein